MKVMKTIVFLSFKDIINYNKFFKSFQYEFVKFLVTFWPVSRVFYIIIFDSNTLSSIWNFSFSEILSSTWSSTFCCTTNCYTFTQVSWSKASWLNFKNLRLYHFLRSGSFVVMIFQYWWIFTVNNVLLQIKLKLICHLYSRYVFKERVM